MPFASMQCSSPSAVPSHPQVPPRRQTGSFALRFPRLLPVVLCRGSVLWLTATAWVHLARATPDLRFDVVTFCCNCTNTGAMMCQPQFDHLNFPTLNGHFLAMGNDSHRADLQANGNVLAIYFNTLNDGWTTNTGASSAALIDQYATNLFSATGPRPDWVVLNEISSGTWPGNQAYRTWVRDVVHALHNTYSYSVIIYSPFPNPGANDADWQAVAADAYIAVENYLSGQEVQANSFSVSWCQSQYQSSLTSYNARGVPTSRLLLGEHFAQTVADTGYGRSGVSSNAWDSAIAARSLAAKNVGFAGFIGYAWDKNGLGVSEDEMIHFEDTYATNPLPAVTGLTPPYVNLQPQSQVAPPGATVVFTVAPAGTAPVGYQWRFDGVAIPGATTSTLTVTNLGPANAGYYSALLTNAAGSALSSNALLQVQIPAPLVAEPFANTSASGGTAYSVGANLIGQTNAQGLTWFAAGSGAGQPVIAAGNLNIPGLVPSSGNSVAYAGAAGTTARVGIAPAGSPINTGTLYYSLALRLDSLGALPASGAIIAGFNNSTGAQSSQPSVIGARLYTRLSGSGYNLGISKADALNIAWDSAVHNTGEVLFVVASYTFGPPGASTTDDSSAMWINPDPGTFGAPAAPPAMLTASAGADITGGTEGQIISFLLREASTLEPGSMTVDELRIGTSWASVTPPSAVPPTLSVTRADGAVVLSWNTNAVGFVLQSASTLAPPSAWGVSSLPVYSSGGQYRATDTLAGVTVFYRLQKP